MKDALGLVRVSTNAQDVARQYDEIEEVKQQYDLNIVRVLRLHGISGTTMLDNAQVQAVLREILQPGIAGLACSAVDRLVRPKRPGDFGIGNAFHDARKTLWTKEEGEMRLWTDQGWSTFVEAAMVAGKEWRRIRSRTRSGKLKMSKLGRNVRGSAALPDGLRYRRITNAAGKTIDCEWSYDEVEVAKVRSAYEFLFQDRFSHAQIERMVGWGRARIRTLRNPVWRGAMAYPATEDHEAYEVAIPLKPVLTVEEWNRAQALLAKRRFWSRETRNQRHLAAEGMLTCMCSLKYYVHGDKRGGQHDGYLCASRHRGGKGCGSAYLWREIVDAAIIEIIEERLTDAKFLTPVFRRVEQAPVTDHRQEREKELAKLAARRKKWIEQYDADHINKAEFEQKMDAVQKAVYEVEARMPATLPTLTLDHRSVVAGLVETLASFATLPFLEQRETLKRVARPFQVINDAIPQVTLSGAFLAELAHTNSAQPSSRL